MQDEVRFCIPSYSYFPPPNNHPLCNTVFMKHTIAVFLLVGATCAAAASMPTSARAHDLLSSLTAGPEQCAASEIDAETDALDTDMDENDLNLRRRAKSKKCYWAGTAPFCMGVCRPGETLIRRSAFGDGARCWTGTKAYCCPPGAVNGPGKSTDPDDDDDKGWRTTTKPAPKATTPAPKATAPITTPGRSQVPLAGQNPSAPKTSMPKGQSGKKTPSSPKQQPPSGGQSEDSPKGPKHLPGKSTKPLGRKAVTNLQASDSDIEVHDDHEDGNRFMKTAKDILSGFKEINKLNFMGHFGEFGASDEIKAEEDSEEHPEYS